MLSRRSFLLLGGAAAIGAGAAGYGLVESEVLPGKVPLDRQLGRCGDTPPVPSAEAVLERGTFRSAARRLDVEYVIARPIGAPAGIPVALVLHGAGGKAATAFDELYWHRHLAEAVAAGTPPFALAAVDGGNRYWHPRADGEDPQGMLVDELLPRLASAGLDTRRVGAMGWSMGGYGSLLLAQRLGRDRVGGVVALSSAVFASDADATAGAFDSDEDFTRHDVVAGAPKLAGIALRVTCGGSDPFAGGNRRLLAALPAGSGEVDSGCHDGAYWRRGATGNLDFLGRALAGTRP